MVLIRIRHTAASGRCHIRSAMEVELGESAVLENETGPSISALSIDNLETLRSVVHEISSGWEFSLRELSRTPAKKSPNAILMFWMDTTDFYRPAVSLEVVPTGFKVIIWDIEEYMTLGTWSRSHHSDFIKAVRAIRTFALQEANYALYAGRTKSPLKVSDFVQKSRSELSQSSDRVPFRGVTLFSLGEE
jgi:hypothetical protein